MPRGGPKSVIFGGVEYPSQTAAAQALGVAQSTVHAALSSPDPEAAILRAQADKRPGKRPIAIGGLTFSSINGAAQAIGIPYHVLFRLSRKPNVKIPDRVLAAAMAYEAQQIKGIER